MLHFVFITFFVHMCMVITYDIISHSILDSKIVKLMLNPQLDQGLKLMKSINSYYNLLDDIDTKLRDPRERFVALKNLKEIVNYNGPKFVNITCDIDLFKIAFMWNNEDIMEFKKVVESVKNKWQDLLELLSNIETHVIS
uniref:Uncharacterized protein n=1 Tax=Clastoptera arizonana TaxID=38151 RepID=A0A1B6CDK8_9HEMI